MKLTCYETILHWILIAEPKEKCLVEMKRGWKDNIKPNLKDIGTHDTDWIYSYSTGYSPAVGSCEDGYEDSAFINGGEFHD